MKILKENQTLIITQKNRYGTFKTGSLDPRYEVIGGYIWDYAKHEVVKELTKDQIIKLTLLNQLAIDMQKDIKDEIDNAYGFKR